MIGPRTENHPKSTSLIPCPSDETVKTKVQCASHAVHHMRTIKIKEPIFLVNSLGILLTQINAYTC